MIVKFFILSICVSSMSSIFTMSEISFQALFRGNENSTEDRICLDDCTS